MIAQRSRIMEAREAAGLDRKRQQFSVERDSGEPQLRPILGRVRFGGADAGPFPLAHRVELQPKGDVREQRAPRTAD